MLMVGGTHNYSNIEYEGTVMIYNNNRWSYLDDDISTKTGVKYINLTSIVEDPKEKNHYFVGSGRHGLYEFKDNKFYKLHTYNNSGLTTIIPADPKNYVSVDGLKYDTKGNLWMVNNEIDTIIKIMKPDGSWKGLYYPEISGLPTFRKLDFDKDGRIWTNSSRYKAGMFCLDINNTLDNNDDDKHKFVGPTFTNQDGVSEIINDIFFFEFDKNGEMWLGTDRGIFVLREPEKFLSDDNVIFERVKIPRNDGTNLADYLLSGIYTTAICIDDANRKWIGTQNNGVFLLSEDGKETIHHFTEENSPLLSNYIQTIAINSSTGSVFFGTSLGLIEYGGDATEPENSLSESNIEVYPNPVNPDFDGPVTIKGMSDKCTVRIVSASGSLVYQGYSNGGTFTWNVTDRNGNRVSSGIYHAIITDLNNSKSTYVSITVIR
jgi:sugar lactone lactonase YvrE